MHGRKNAAWPTKAPEWPTKKVEKQLLYTPSVSELKSSDALPHWNFLGLWAHDPSGYFLETRIKVCLQYISVQAT